MKKIFDRISVILFFIFIVFFSSITIINSIILKKVTIENFPLYNGWKRIYSNIADLVGQEKIGDIFISEDKDKHMLNISDKNIKFLNSNIDQLNEFTSDNDKTWIMLVPTAYDFYVNNSVSDFSKDDFNRYKNLCQTDINDVYSKLSNAYTMDVYDALYSNKDNYIFFRTDRSWTPFGAYCAYESALSILYNDPVDFSDYNIKLSKKNFYGNLYYKTFYNNINPDYINQYEYKQGNNIEKIIGYKKNNEENSNLQLYNDNALYTNNALNYYLYGNTYDKLVIETSYTKHQKLLIVKGSYANIIVPFLCQHYSEITLVDPAKSDNNLLNDYNININDYDNILFLFDIEEFNQIDLSCINK